jgi:hypothetical protein
VISFGVSILPTELTLIDNVKVLEVVLVPTENCLDVVLEYLLQSGRVGDAGDPGRSLCDRVRKRVSLDSCGRTVDTRLRIPADIVASNHGAGLLGFSNDLSTIKD